MRDLYPALEPYVHGHLAVGDGHRIYFEDCGRRDGLALVFLHGGPGSGCSPDHRRLFDPNRYRVILFDQRGAGRSLPAGKIEFNTAQHLVHDLERLRNHFGIRRWVVCGGSWGAALALMYAQAHPQRVLALILRGVFLARDRDITWFFGPDGAARLFPEAHARLLAALPDVEVADTRIAAYRGITSEDPQCRASVARAWDDWESALVGLRERSNQTRSRASIEPLEQRVRIAAHYGINGFFCSPRGALARPERLHGLPGIIVHGRCDLVCPVEQAATLHRLWPQSNLEIVEGGGHVLPDPLIRDALIRAQDRIADLLAGNALAGLTDIDRHSG